jgi:hypothetical protein
MEAGQEGFEFRDAFDAAHAGQIDVDQRHIGLVDRDAAQRFFARRIRV